MAETFDPGAVIMQFGPLLIQGFAEGDMIRVEPRSEGDTLAVGSGGETARVKSRDKSATVTAILMDTHPINIALIAYHNLGNVAAPLSVSLSGNWWWVAIALGATALGLHAHVGHLQRADHVVGLQHARVNGAGEAHHIHVLVHANLLFTGHHQVAVGQHFDHGGGKWATACDVGDSEARAKQQLYAAGIAGA